MSTIYSVSNIVIGIALLACLAMSMLGYFYGLDGWGWWLCGVFVFGCDLK